MSARSRTSRRKWDTRMTVRPPADEHPDDGVEPLDLGRRQAGARLVEDDELGVAGEGAQDLDLLLLGQGQAADPGVAGRSNPVSAGQALEALGHRRRRSMNPARRGSTPRNTFSATVRCGTRATSWATRAMPRRGRPAARRSDRLRRAGAALPWSGAMTPAMILPRVDLPAPFSPTKAWTVPAAMVSDTSSRARVAPKDLPRPWTARWTSSSVDHARSVDGGRLSGRSARPLREGQEGLDVGLGHDAALGQVVERVHALEDLAACAWPG